MSSASPVFDRPMAPPGGPDLLSWDEPGNEALDVRVASAAAEALAAPSSGLALAAAVGGGAGNTSIDVAPGGKKHSPVQELIALAQQGDVSAMLELSEIYEKQKDIPLAIKYSSMAAKKEGNPTIIMRTAKLCLEGRQGEEAVRWFTRAAKTIPEANLELGKMYLMGSGVKQDRKRAIEYLQPLANKGDTDAMFFLAYAQKAISSLRDSARSYMEKAVALGHPGAKLYLSIAYVTPGNDLGVSTDGSTKRAAQMYVEIKKEDVEKWASLCGSTSRSAIQLLENQKERMKMAEESKDNSAAVDKEAERLFELGTRYDVAKDYTQALHWYLKAAEMGHVLAMHNCGVIYRGGLGIKRDVKASIQWFEKAAENGLVESMCQLGDMYQGTGGAKQDYKKSYHWYRTAVAEGCGKAIRNCGIFCRDGLGIERDIKAAILCFEQAAEEGCKQSMYDLGYMYQMGEHVERDYKLAIYWYEKASEKGFPNATCKLAVFHEMGVGVSKDINRAIELYRKAAAAGDEGAQFRLTQLLPVEKPS